jgi:Ca2+-binding RTX toxin-like protein
MTYRNDPLIGRKGADRFLLSGGVDRIIDFNTWEGDQLVISRRTFPSVAPTLTRIHDDRLLPFVSRSRAALIYNIGNGNLYFNANGRRPGFGAGGGLIAELGSANLTIESIVVL